ncbi:hypothetical protein D3C75_1297280 [compost metagenome]
MLQRAGHHLVDHFRRLAIDAGHLLIHPLGAGRIAHLIIGQRRQVLLFQPGVNVTRGQHLAVIHADFGQQFAQRG